MPQDKYDFLQKLQENGVLSYIWLLLVSLLAGTARYFVNLGEEKPRLTGWFAENTTCVLAGMIAYHICLSYSVEHNLSLSISWLAAWNGTKSLSLLTKLLKKTTNKIARPVEDDESGSVYASKKRD